MTTCKETDRSLKNVLAGLVISVTVVMVALTHLLASAQPLV
jgi:hypothetical protein